MIARKIHIKLFVDGASDTLDPDPFVPVFHRFIRENTLKEVLIDVTDYAHVRHAPAVLLVGHASDYAIDFAEGRPGLLYIRKREAPADDAASITDALRRALLACARLEEEKSFERPLRFRTDEILFRINDRLHARNTDATFGEVKPLLEKTFGNVFTDGVALERVGSARELFTVRVKAKSQASVTELLARVS